MSFETKCIQLAAPVNLAADTDVDPGPVDELATFVFIQNTGDAVVLWRETAGAPVATDPGHQLPAGAAIVALLYEAAPFWLWSPDGSGAITVSPGAPMPVRTGV